MAEEVYGRKDNKIEIFKAWNTFRGSRRPYRKLTEQQWRAVEDINGRILEGKIQFESVSCLCGNTEFQLISPVDRHGILQNTVLCIQCGLVLSNPRMTESEYASFYSSDIYRICYEGADFIETNERKFCLGTGEHIFDEIVQVKPITEDTSILELGAGGGWNLVPFVKAGARVVGMDYSPSLVDLGRRHGIEMIQGGVDDIRGQYDVIILNHVLEHLLEPVDALKQIGKHLAPAAIMYIGVPNIMNFGIGQLQNAHVWYFSPRTLEHYCNLAGLELLKIDVVQVHHMFGIFEMGPKQVYEDFNKLKGHYDEMRSIVRKANAKEYIKGVLSRSHLMEPAMVIYRWFCSR